MLLVATMSGTASAKVETTGGGGGGTTTCSPVSSLTYKGDARAGETGLATISVSYGVKPCTSAAVVVDARLFLTANPAAISYDDANAPLNGKFTVAGIRPNTSYQVRITVTDAATGAVVGSKTIFAGAVTKGV